jgi:hypothetical protein
MRRCRALGGLGIGAQEGLATPCVSPALPNLRGGGAALPDTEQGRVVDCSFTAPLEHCERVAPNGILPRQECPQREG